MLQADRTASDARAADTTLRTVPEIIAGVDGWLTLEEGELLHRLAREARGPGVIVEIGSWKGRSTLCLARGSELGAGLPVIAIDPHTGSPEQRQEFGEVWTFEVFAENVRRAGLQHLVRPLVMDSVEAAAAVTEPVRLIFIDGAHEVEAVRRDFAAWFPRVEDGGVMAFHDSAYWNGPGQVLAESVYGSPRFRRPGWAGSITHVQKVARRGPLEALEMRARAWLRTTRERVARARRRAGAEPSSPGGAPR